MRKLDTTQAKKTVTRAVSQQHGVIVSDIIFIKPATLSRTSSGKIQRSATAKQYLNGDLPSIISQSVKTVKPLSYQCLTTLLEQQPGANKNVISRHTAFADLALDSLGAVQLAEQLSQQLGRTVEPMLIWDHPTVGELCDHLDGQSAPVDASAINNSKRQTIEPIAVIGMAVRLPGGLGKQDIQSLDGFWDLLQQGTEIIGELPPNRQADFGGKTDTLPHGAFLNQVDQFDPGFFELSGREAVCLDPQQRLLLQVSWQALQDGGVNQARIRDSHSGIFIGLSTDDYASLAKNSEQFEQDPGYLGLGTARSVAAGRLAYFLGCKGPALTVDTACSSSAYAIHLACQSLARGESTMALAGGVNLMLANDGFKVLDDLKALSPTNRCHTFSDDADGYVRGEGCGMLVLKPLKQAQLDGDKIYGTINASVANQDGRSNGLTAPNGTAQRALIQSALTSAGLNPAQIGYIETHGTGTPLGDPIEVNAIADTLGVKRQHPLLLGALKSQIGHLEAAAGVMGLIKTLLCLHHQKIVANQHFSSANRHVDWQNLAVTPVNTSQSWPQVNDTPLMAGVSAFGLSGTNVHFTLGAKKPLSSTATQTKTSKTIWPLLTLSGHSQNAVRRLAEQVSQTPIDKLDTLLSASQTSSHFDWRISCVVKDPAVFAEQLSKALITQTTGPAAPAGTVFLFTGQGGVHAGMGKTLYQMAPAFKASIDQAQSWLNSQNQNIALTELLFSPEQQNQLQQPQHAQLALYIIQVALVDWFAALGIKPVAVAGHSVGEFAAAYCVGAINAEQGYQLVKKRGELTAKCVPGVMLAVALNSECAHLVTGN